MVGPLNLLLSDRNEKTFLGLVFITLSKQKSAPLVSNTGMTFDLGSPSKDVLSWNSGIQAMCNIFSAIIITGGIDDNLDNTRSVEVLRDDGSYWCSLPDLYDYRDHHTQSGLVACGGTDNTAKSCSTFISGQWTLSHTLQQWRIDHSSWTSQFGTILLGGWGLEGLSEDTTEKLTEGGLSVQNFTLKYRTR